MEPEEHEVVNCNGIVTAEAAARHALRLAIAAEEADQEDLRLDWRDLLRGAEVWAALSVALSIVGPTDVRARGNNLLQGI